MKGSGNIKWLIYMVICKGRDVRGRSSALIITLVVFVLQREGGGERGVNPPWFAHAILYGSRDLLQQPRPSIPPAQTPPASRRQPDPDDTPQHRCNPRHLEVTPWGVPLGVPHPTHLCSRGRTVAPQASPCALLGSEVEQKIASIQVFNQTARVTARSRGRAAEVAPMGAPTLLTITSPMVLAMHFHFFFFFKYKTIHIYERLCHYHMLCSFSIYETSCFQAF